MQNRKSKPPVFIRSSCVGAEPKGPLVVPAESDAGAGAAAVPVLHPLADTEHGNGRVQHWDTDRAGTWQRAGAAPG